MKEKNSNTTLIPTNLDTPDINLAQANNETNNQTEYQQNNLKEAIKNKNKQQSEETPKKNLILKTSTTLKEMSTGGKKTYNMETQKYKDLS